jgi:hypothetical protein
VDHTTQYIEALAMNTIAHLQGLLQIFDFTSELDV